MAQFEDTLYVTIYELARDGLSNNQIGKTIGVSRPTFDKWAKRPAVADALTRGRRGRDPGDEFAFHDYIYDRLEPKLQDLWDKIKECETLPNGVERIEALLESHGMRARQHMFLYALTQSAFNVSKSLRTLNITKRTFEHWCNNDPGFSELMDEIHFHKKNFFENAFIRQVKQGQIMAVLHAVKTQCRDRGYGDQIAVEHTGTITHKHAVVITDLNLPIAIRQAVLQALRHHQETIQATQPTIAPAVPVLTAPAEVGA